VIEEELSDLAGLTVRKVRQEFGNLASDWETLRADEDEWERRHPNPRFLGAWRRHREIYGYTLRAELVYALKTAFDEDPDLELEGEFTHVLADEYQDLNHCEIAVLQRLGRSRPKLLRSGRRRSEHLGLVTTPKMARWKLSAFAMEHMRRTGSHASAAS
jgi:DNA helicase II / ATP-dependent DNA helicase PcrA